MRILVCTTVAITHEAFLLPFAERAAALGWQVDGAALGLSQSAQACAVYDSVFDIEWTRRPWEITRIVRSIRAIRAVVEEGDYDVVHVHTPVASWITRAAIRSVDNRPAVIYTAHGFHFYEGAPRVWNWLFRKLERRAAKWTDWIVVMNHEDHTAALAFPEIGRERVRHIRGIGVDCDAIQPLTALERSEVRAQLGIAADEFMVAVVAEFNRNKRQSLIAEGIARCEDPTVAVVFVGDGPLRSEVQHRAESLRLRATFTGYRSDASRIIAASDSLLVAARREGLPRVVLEAMAAQVPVLTTRTRGAVDLVDDRTGYVIAAATPIDIARAVDGAAGELAEVRRSRGECGRNLVCGDYSLSVVLEDYMRLYREAASARVQDR